MAEIQLVLRTAALLACVALAAIIVASRGNATVRFLGALYLAGVGAFVLTSSPGASAWPPVIHLPLTLVCVIKAGVFLFFSRALFVDGFNLRGRHLLLLAMLGVYGLWQQTMLLPALRGGTGSMAENLAALGFEGFVLALIVAAAMTTYRDLASDLVEQRRRLRLLLVQFGGAYLAVATGVQVYNFLLGVRTPVELVFANLLLIFVACIVAAVTLLDVRRSNWLNIVGPVADRPEGTEHRHILDMLHKLMEQERVYREERLSIGKLAGRLGVREYVLRRAINQGLGFRNFNDFLHSWRIREASMRLDSEPERPILSIALDVGYASIGPFNRAFKLRNGMTPSAFRRRMTVETPRT